MFLRRLMQLAIQQRIWVQLSVSVLAFRMTSAAKGHRLGVQVNKCREWKRQVSMRIDLDHALHLFTHSPGVYDEP
jgi:hypothetical protein